MEEVAEQPTYYASIKIPRCYSPNINITQTIQLHLFVDASEEAMAAVAYFRIENESKIDVTMVAAKVKVSPLKPTTIPRLELHAAVIGSRLATVIRSQHNISFEKTFFWSDSTTVLHWIGSEHRRLKQFVAHRLGEISESTNITDWNWVPTKENVADDATRLDFQNLETESRWFRGPSFLYQTENLWPKRVIRSASVDVEERHEIINLVLTTTRPVVPDIFKFSSWLRLIRTTAWLYRYYHNCRYKEERKNGELSVGEFQDAELLWIKESQHLSFSKEIASLSQGTQVERSSRLYKLSPAMINGIIRIKGRLDNLPDSDLWIKYPAILDGRESYTRLLIKHYHEVSNHMGYERVLNELNQRYWILKVRPVLRGVNFACNKCKIRRAKPQPTIMGQLPAARLTSCLPFTYTGVDFFGPITVKTGRRREKRYGMLFTCLTVRAVHVEITPSLETDTCINAMRRFVARRGCPKEMFSDNGTNLKGAERELRECLAKLDQDEIRGSLTSHRIKWNFIPPASPHMGGCWERLVRSIKTALYVVLGAAYPTDDILLTLMAEVEQMTNSRPLVEVSHDPEDPEALTPNHFLLGRSSATAPVSDFDDKDLILRKQWRAAQSLADHFWMRWRKAFLPGLNRRTKWFQPTRKLQVGDIVLVYDENQHRGLWPKGLITRVYPGQDDQIRVADVRLSNGKVYTRPAAKLCLLNFEAEGNAIDPSTHCNTGGQNVDEI